MKMNIREPYSNINGWDDAEEVRQVRVWMATTKVG